jgi:hypothetical protein
MARRGQQKAIVSAQDLPPLSRLSNGNFGYMARFRIIAEDGSRFSDWSNINNVEFDINSFNISLPLDLDVNVSSSTISVAWEDVLENAQYDVFVSFDGNPYVYHGTTPIHTYSFLNTEAYNEVSVIIQLASIPREVDSLIQVAATSAPVPVV